MKNKKLLYIIIGLVLIVGIILFIIFNSHKPELNEEPKNDTLVTELQRNTKKKYDLKFKGGEVLNENTSFRDYAFISDNKIYIYNPEILKKNEISYTKVYDLPNDIKVMNIRPGYGADINFIDYNDIEYTLHDDNIDNKISIDYSNFLNAKYVLSDSLKWTYSTEFLGKKIDYDFMSNYVYAKDDKLYAIIYGNERYPQIEPISGNYENEKVVRIYNERILKTDKGYYEIVKYFDKELNKYVYLTLKIKLLSKYYDEVLTFNYKYVILKDYTLIPLTDIIVRNPAYQENYFITTLDNKPETLEE